MSWSRLPDWILAGCAVILVGRALWPSGSGATPDTGEPEALPREHWELAARTDLRIGPAWAPDSMIEFVDFECPYCAVFAERLKTIRSTIGSNRLVVLIRHLPLSGHRFAIPAAIVAECADQQGQFAEIYDRLFERQDSFGLKPWVEYAREAGVPNVARFASCLELPADSFPRIAEGLDVASRTNVAGTPTIWVNGMRGPPGGIPASFASELGLVRMPERAR